MRRLLTVLVVGTIFFVAGFKAGQESARIEAQQNAPNAATCSPHADSIALRTCSPKLTPRPPRTP